MVEHDGEGMRETIEALLQEHVSFELFEVWREEASREASDPAELARLVKKRTLLCLAERTSGEVQTALRNLAGRL